MKFSTQTLRKIQNLLAEEFTQHLGKEAITSDEIEQALRKGLQEVGQASFGEMLTLLDESSYQIEERCECQQLGNGSLAEKRNC
jgi:hypothetical protein